MLLCPVTRPPQRVRHSLLPPPHLYVKTTHSRSISFPSSLRPLASNLCIFIQLRTPYPQWSAPTPFPSITSALFPMQRRGRGYSLTFYLGSLPLFPASGEAPPLLS